MEIAAWHAIGPGIGLGRSQTAEKLPNSTNVKEIYPDTGMPYEPSKGCINHNHTLLIAHP
ncbi:MAG: hypothetical protein WBB01_21880 [Phormidesmis sp.]